MADEIPAYPYLPYSFPYLLLPLPLPIPITTPTITPTLPLTYYLGHLWKGGARGCHLTAKYYHGGVICFWPIQPVRGWGGGGGVAYVLSNTKYFNVLLEVGGGAWPPLGTHMTITPTPPLTYYYLYSTIPLVHGVR